MIPQPKRRQTQPIAWMCRRDCCLRSWNSLYCSFIYYDISATNTIKIIGAVLTLEHQAFSSRIFASEPHDAVLLPLPINACRSQEYPKNVIDDVYFHAFQTMEWFFGHKIVACDDPTPRLFSFSS